MKVLAVLPDGNITDIVGWVAKWNPDLEWDVVGVGHDCAWEPLGWAKNFTRLDCDYRETCSYPQELEEGDDIGLGGRRDFAYEDACQWLRSPLLGNWFHYHKHELLVGAVDLDNLIRPKDDYDVLVTWGERGWYNEVAIGIAQKHGKPICRLERSTFPGMLVADGTGLEQGRCDLHSWHTQVMFNSMCPAPRTRLEHWLSVAPWQNIESQPRTTLGMAKILLDYRPSIFVPLQVPVDTNMIFRTEDIHNNYGMLEYVAEQYPGHNVIVKKHPADGFTCPDKLQAYCDERGFQLVNAATHALLRMVDRIISINSQVIIEAWMHGLRPEILGQPAFDLPDEQDKEALLYTLRFAYYIEPWQLTERLRWIADE